MSPRKRKSEEAPKGSPAWMTSYGDLMSLLLVFFILLFSFSVVNVEDFIKTIGSIDAAISGSKGTFKLTDDNSVQSPVPSGRAPVPSEAKGGGTSAVKKPPVATMKKIQVTRDEVQAMVELKNTIEKKVIGESGQENINLTITERGLQVSLKEQILFDRAKAKLHSEVGPVLNVVGETLMSNSFSVRIEGHTCELPIDTTEFPSNWELSTARAVSVSRYLIEEGQIAPERFSVTGYGEYKPLVPNTSEENRSLNRRVDIIVLYPKLSLQEPK
jgi:chemotaxis protein MotB